MIEKFGYLPMGKYIAFDYTKAFFDFHEIWNVYANKPLVRVIENNSRMVNGQFVLSYLPLVLPKGRVLEVHPGKMWSDGKYLYVMVKAEKAIGIIDGVEKGDNPVVVKMTLK